MKYITSLTLLCFFLVGFQSSVDRINFSGKWKLDTKKSANLPASFQHVDAYVMEVRQTADSIIVNVSLSGDGQDVKLPVTVYACSGTEIYREDTLRGSKRWSKGVWTTTGKKFIIDNRVEQKRGEQKYTQRDIWQLNDQNTLQISVTQQFDMHDSTRSERRVFHRVK